jgi:hypothetical protein
MLLADRLWRRGHALGLSFGTRGGDYFSGEVINWGKPIPSGCFSLATVESYPAPAYVGAVTVNGNGGPGTQVRLATSSHLPVDVAVICPQS